MGSEHDVSTPEFADFYFLLWPQAYSFLTFGSFLCLDENKVGRFVDSEAVLLSVSVFPLFVLELLLNLGNSVFQLWHS